MGRFMRKNKRVIASVIAGALAFVMIFSIIAMFVW